MMNNQGAVRSLRPKKPHLFIALFIGLFIIYLAHANIASTSGEERYTTTELKQENSLLSIAGTNISMYSTQTTNLLENFSKKAATDLADSPLDIDDSKLENEASRNLFKYRAEDRYPLKEDNLALIPYPPHEDQTYLKIERKLPDADQIIVGIEARNAAALNYKPSRILEKNCAQSKVTLNIKQNLRESQNQRLTQIIQKQLLIDRSITESEVDISELRNKNVILEVKLNDATNCGSKINEAVIIKDFYISSKNSKIPLIGGHIK